MVRTTKSDMILNDIGIMIKWQKTQTKKHMSKARLAQHFYAIDVLTALRIHTREYLNK